MVAPSWAIPPGPRVMVGVLHTGTTSMDWAKSFRALQLPDNLVSFVSHWPFDVARNQICTAALNSHAEWLFFLDSDVIPPVDAFARLSRHNLPVVQGLYHSKAGQHHPQIMRRAEQVMPDGKKQLVFQSLLNFNPGELIPVDTVATGCLLIHNRVLKAFRDAKLPWFEWTMGRQALIRDFLGISKEELDNLEESVALADAEVRPWVGQARAAAEKVIQELRGEEKPEGKPWAGLPAMKKVVAKLREEEEPEGLSEDYTFGVRAKKLGFPLFVDTSVTCTHVTMARITGFQRLEQMETP